MTTKNLLLLSLVVFAATMAHASKSKPVQKAQQNVSKKDLDGSWDLKSVSCSLSKTRPKALEKGTLKLKNETLTLEFYDKAGSVEKAFETKLFALQENMLTVPVKDTYATFEIKRQGPDLILRSPVIGPANICPEGNLLVMNFKK